jgi:hypothetical protein
MPPEHWSCPGGELDTRSQRASTVTKNLYKLPRAGTTIDDVEVADVAVYRDTVVILRPTALVGSQLAELRRLNGGGFNDIKQKKTKYAHVSRWKWRVSIRYAKAQTLERLAAIDSDYLISRFDVALDLMTTGKAWARRLAADMYQRLCLRCHRAARGLRIERGRHGERFTIYWGPADARRSIAVYADRVSKVTGAPCCHVEFRTIGSDACGRAITGDAYTRPTIAGLLAVDHERIVRKEFRVFNLTDGAAFRQAFETKLRRDARKEFESASQVPGITVIPSFGLRVQRRRWELKTICFGKRDVGDEIPWEQAPAQLIRDHMPRSLVYRYQKRVNLIVP